MLHWLQRCAAVWAGLQSTWGCLGASAPRICKPSAKQAQTAGPVPRPPQPGEPGPAAAACALRLGQEGHRLIQRCSLPTALWHTISRASHCALQDVHKVAVNWSLKRITLSTYLAEKHVARLSH